MIYKSNKLLYVLILICIHILNVSECTISFYRHKNDDAYEDFDITTIYRITNMSSFNGIFDRTNSVIEIHSRTNAIGMPIQDKYDTKHIISTNVKEITDFLSFQNNSRMSISITSDHWNRNTIHLDGTSGCNKNFYRNNYGSYTDDQEFNKCYTVFEHSFGFCMSESNFYSSTYDKNEPDTCSTFFSFYWTPDKDDQTCLTMTYYTKYYASEDWPFIITMGVEDENNMLISHTVLEEYNGISTLKITNIDFKKNQEYKLSLKLALSNKNQARDVARHFKFGFIRIGQCSNYDEEDVRIISIGDVYREKPNVFHILGNSRVKRPFKLSRDSCLNGGYSIEKSSKCVCPPGFKGQFCETGCGVNSYGSDCKGVCSIQADKMCRGMVLCTIYGCTCPVGLTGPMCNKDCTMSKYGADCTQNCSKHCLSNMCDKYTGVCLYGCSGEYIPPNCNEKYPYFIDPPTLRSANYESIEIELNFEENYIIGGDKIIKPKYFQLFYKSLIENTFRSSEIKSISDTNNTTTEVISDLEPDTKYEVGVLLIAGDGNFNEQDIVYGQYKTTCMQPQITDYNIKLISGIQSINITWSIVRSTSNRLECNTTKHVLTLMSNHPQNQISDVQEIISSTDNGHVLDNLLPGFQYNIKLTPSTSNGTLPPSPIYSITTLMTRNDVQIKNITTKHEYGKIKVNWILVNVHQHYTTVVDEPVTSIIKYKVKKILSCSIREVEQNWTSIKVFNLTNYEIFDIVPNSQYSIQVSIEGEDKNTIQQENMSDILTPASIPKTEPILDPDHPVYITNNSIFVQWKFDSENCSKLNGFFSQFYIELKDKVSTILQIRETKNKYISFNELKSNTAYELKVFIKTHIGYNPEHFLLINFTTKFENLKPVEDLVVYKKSRKSRMAGFRWSYSEETNVDGFIVSLNENPLINTNNFSIIPPQKCSAWPEYYCHTFYNLTPSNNYTFKIQPKSIDFPEGGKVSTIYFNSIDGLPDSPMNIKTTEIGSTTIALQWDIPWIFNGVLKMFIINIEEISSIDMDTCCVNITPVEIPVYEELPTYNYTITGLKSGSTYSVGVLTVSKSLWYSSPSRLSVTTV